MQVGWAVLELETFGTFSLKGFFRQEIRICAWLLSSVHVLCCVSVAGLRKCILKITCLAEFLKITSP